MFSRLLKLTFGCGSVFMRYAILVLLYIQPEYILLKLITITCVHTQDVESQATEPTEQSAKVLESKTKSMIFHAQLFFYWLCVEWDDEKCLRDERHLPC